MKTKQTLIQAKLFSFEDKKYKDFNKKMILNIDDNTMIGIRIPVLCKFTKEFFNVEPEQVSDFMKDMSHKYFEENNLHGFFIENIKDFDEAVKESEKFLPYIDDWATCDSFSPKIFKKHHEEIYKKNFGHG